MLTRSVIVLGLSSLGLLAAAVSQRSVSAADKAPPPAAPAQAAKPAAPAAAPAPARALPPEAELALAAPKKLKQLPKTMKGEELKQVMLYYEKSLGVDCAFCHNTNDFASDEKKHKKIAIDMIKATATFNKQLFKGKPKATCMMCHRGEKEPEVP